MFKINHCLSLLVCSVMTLTLVYALANPASANSGSALEALDLIESSCTTAEAQHSKLSQFKIEIATAETVSQAREMALAPTDMAIEALKNADTILPFSEDLQKAETRLSDTRSRILVAASQEQVADAFSGMMLAGLDDDRAASVKVGHESCSYSTGEVIAIVIGLILGIIPGLILLVVLC